MTNEEFKLFEDLIGVLNDHESGTDVSISVLITILMQALIGCKLTKTEIFTLLNSSYESVIAAEKAAKKST